MPAQGELAHDPPARTPQAAGRLLDQCWLQEGFRDDEQYARCRDRARDVVSRYAQTRRGRLTPAVR